MQNVDNFDFDAEEEGSAFFTDDDTDNLDFEDDEDSMFADSDDLDMFADLDDSEDSEDSNDFADLEDSDDTDSDMIANIEDSGNIEESNDVDDSFDFEISDDFARSEESDNFGDFEASEENSDVDDSYFETDEDGMFSESTDDENNDIKSVDDSDLEDMNFEDDENSEFGLNSSDFDDVESEFEDDTNSFFGNSDESDNQDSHFDEGNMEDLSFDESSNSLDLDNDTTEESEDKESEKSSDTKSDYLRSEYNATFNGEEQLEHSLYNIIGKVNITAQKLKIEDLVPSNFKKMSRASTIIGLNGIVSQWGIINPIHVMKLEDEGMYLILDGLRRVYAAMKNGMQEIDCRVWDFDDVTEGKRLANVISLMLNKTERYKPLEQWNMMHTLESGNDLSPALLEYLIQLEAGQAMKLKDVMLCEEDYIEIRQKLVDGEIDIEGAYKKLCAERKKDNRLLREDNTAVENTLRDESREAEDDNRKLSDAEVHDLLELADTDATGKAPEELDMTDEIRGDDKYQTTDERHPVDQAIRQGTFIRDDFHCRCCGIGGVEWLGVLVFHHAVPVYAGGPDTIENGLTLCQNCHMTLHNYIQGKVQADLDNMTDNQRVVFKNIFKYGNIAIKAVKSKGIKREDLAKLDKTGSHHDYPDAHIKENTLMFNQAQLESSNSEKLEDITFEEGTDDAMDTSDEMFNVSEDSEIELSEDLDLDDPFSVSDN